jgi:hypothetical protein
MLMDLPAGPLDMFIPPGPPMDILLVEGDASEEFGVGIAVLVGD